MATSLHVPQHDISDDSETEEEPGNLKHEHQFSYPKGDDEMQDMTELVNFSSAFKNRRFGDALCLSNPAAGRKLDAKLSEINKQQRRRKADLYQRQRSFFIDQIFAKGLNPFLNKQDGKLLNEDEHGSCLTTRSEPGTIGHYSAKNGDYRNTNKDKTSYPQLFPLVRSQTMGNIPGKTDQENSMRNVWTSQSSLNPSHTHAERDKAVLLTQRRPAKFTHKHRTQRKVSRSSLAHENERQPQLSPIKEGVEFRNQPKVHLEKYPYENSQHSGALFPKMQMLIAKSKNPYSQTNSNPTTPKVVRRYGEYLHLPEMPPNSPDEGGKFGPKHVMKMINNLSTDLPPHLRSTATQQIRTMTNSDEIYAQKAVLKQENLPLLRREKTLQDRRWFKLHSSLSPLKDNDALNWRKISGTWTPFTYTKY